MIKQPNLNQQNQDVEVEIGLMIVLLHNDSARASMELSQR